MNPDISIIIPFLNEEENIPRLISGLNSLTGSNERISFEIIFVDDGSTDNSLKFLQEASINSSVKIIKLSRNYGSHSALRAGIINSEGNYVTFMYADLQDPPDLILKMYELCLNGNDIVWGVRSTIKSGVMEKLFSGLYAGLMKRFVNPGYPKNGFDVAMFNSKIRSELNKNIEANSSVFLQILNLGFKQDSVYYDKAERVAGRSKWTLDKKFKLFIDSFVAFSYFPIRFVTVMGIIFFIAGIMWTMYIVLREIIIGDLTPGWPALVSILMICFGVTNISLGIIAEYLWRTLDASRNRPVFIIEEIIEVSSDVIKYQKTEKI